MKARKLKDCVCEYPGCNETAESIVYSNSKDAVMLCCFDHTDKVWDADTTEYGVSCPNCGCKFGV